MFSSKSPIVKVVGYLIIGFFSLIIIISFGMPDFMSRLGQNPNIIANVNGEEIHRLDFLRYRDSRFRDMQSKGMEKYILNRFISEVLLTQHAKDLNFEVSDQKIAKYVKEMSFLQNPETKEYDPERLERVLKGNRMNLNDFYKLIKKDLINKDFYQSLSFGIAIPKDDLEHQSLCENSEIKIKYASVSETSLKKFFKKKLAVSDQEIEEEMNKKKIQEKENKNEKSSKDLENEKKRITENLKSKKLKDIKKDLIEKVNKLADQKWSFNKAVSILKAKVSFSKTAKIGEPLKENKKDGKTLSQIYNSKIFREKFLSLEKGKTSPVIESGNTLYIFTPLLKKIKKKELSAEEQETIAKKLEQERVNNLAQNLTTALNEKAKIVTFLKED